jgi:starch phosphorylase
MPEALEKWPVEMVQKYLPRHLQLIGEINRRFLEDIIKRKGDGPWVSALSLFQEDPEKCIRMGNLGVLGSNKVNGVAAIHTEIIKKETFSDFFQWFNAIGETNKFVNMTNGVTPRRWIHLANRPLSDIFTKHLGTQKWLVNMDLQKSLTKKKNDPQLQKEWMAAKRAAKVRLCKWLKETINFEADPDMLFDCQFKRIHEYKRQLLNAIYLIHRYLTIKAAPANDRAKMQKRFCFFGGKAAPAYVNAKIIIKLINNIAEVVNNDPDVSPYLKVCFVPNYSVTVAQVVCPASDLSQHISTAGTEASGTSNMKFVMNGGLIIGTMDGANIEIREEGGDDTMFIFGCLEDQVEGIKAKARAGHYPIDPRMEEVFKVLRRGDFSLGDQTATTDFVSLITKLSNGIEAGTWNGDKYLLCADFASYCDAQAKVDKTYADQAYWTSLSIQAACGMAKFSTDRTIREYAETIWDIKPSPRPLPQGQVAKPTGKITATEKKITAPKATGGYMQA